VRYVTTRLCSVRYVTTRLRSVRYVTTRVREHLFALIIFELSDHFYDTYDKRHYVTKQVAVGWGVGFSNL
jgi:hypothetical protein